MPNTVPNTDDVATAPEATADDQRPIMMGPPFAMAGGCDLLERGCWAAVECECGQKFRIDLLTPGAKPCPGCDVEYTHALVVTYATDDEMAQDLFECVLSANGILPPADDSDDDGEDADDDQDDDGDDADDDTRKG